jgi:hypothetical protein
MIRSKFLLSFFTVVFVFTIGKDSQAQAVAYFEKATGEELLAVKEVQRYLYLRTGKIPSLTALDNNSRLPSNSILVAFSPGSWGL